MKEKTDYWLKDLDLTFNDKLILQSSEWLNDSLIFAAQMLLKKQSNGILGWKSTQCAKRAGKEKFPPIPQGTPFIQILHVSDNHWITVSNINIKLSKTAHSQDSVSVYDSGCSSTISLETKELICGFFKSNKDVLLFEVMNVHTQPNLTDCGLFAIAFATELVFGQDPVLSFFDCASMRPHLMQCLEAGVFERFPCKKQRRVPFGSRVRVTHKVDVFCSCCMPNDKDKAMIKCENCRKWYHKECEGVDKDKSYKGKPWQCTSCNNFVKSLN